MVLGKRNRLSQGYIPPQNLEDAAKPPWSLILWIQNISLFNQTFNLQKRERKNREAIREKTSPRNFYSPRKQVCFYKTCYYGCLRVVGDEEIPMLENSI